MENSKNHITDSDSRITRSGYQIIGPENAARLYSALDGADMVRPEDITFTTLSGVLFMARKK